MEIAKQTVKALNLISRLRIFPCAILENSERSQIQLSKPRQWQRLAVLKCIPNQSRNYGSQAGENVQET
jgi:hypothetical protein